MQANRSVWLAVGQEAGAAATGLGSADAPDVLAGPGPVAARCPTGAAVTAGGEGFNATAAGFGGGGLVFSS